MCYTVEMARKMKVAAPVGRRRHPRKRAEQQRSLETRTSILNAAICHGLVIFP
jgi:hypothetical protein